MSTYGYQANYSLRFPANGIPVELFHMYTSNLDDINVNVRPLVYHRHAHIELQYALRGQGTFCTQSGSEPFSAGQLILIPPRTSHQVMAEQSGLHRLTIALRLLYPTGGSRTEETRRFYAAFHGSQPVTLSVKPGSELRHILNAMLDMVSNKKPDPPTQERLRCYCTLLLLNLYRQMPDPEPDRLLPPAVGQQALFIDDFLHNYIDRKNLAALLANTLHVSPRQLNRIVQNTFGTCLRDKINTVRVEFALEQLTNTDIPIATIAGLLGYGSTSAFDSFIKNQTGRSPTRIRAERSPLSPTLDTI